MNSLIFSSNYVWEKAGVDIYFTGVFIVDFQIISFNYKFHFQPKKELYVAIRQDLMMVIKQYRIT